MFVRIHTKSRGHFDVKLSDEGLQINPAKYDSGHTNASIVPIGKEEATGQLVYVAVDDLVALAPFKGSNE